MKSSISRIVGMAGAQPTRADDDRGRRGAAQDGVLDGQPAARPAMSAPEEAVARAGRFQRLGPEDARSRISPSA